MIHACDDAPADVLLANSATLIFRFAVVACSRSSPEHFPERVCWVQMDVKEHQALFDTNYFGVVCFLPVLIVVCHRDNLFLATRTERSFLEQRQRQHALLLLAVLSLTWKPRVGTTCLSSRHHELIKWLRLIWIPSHVEAMCRFAC